MNLINRIKRWLLRRKFRGLYKDIEAGFRRVFKEFLAKETANKKEKC